jgi:glycosyltransferase involved in cell wall biosynthesis
MKVIFYHANPFFLAHGGTQTLVEALMREIAGLGVEVEPARWWDERQRGDILHFINRPGSSLVQGARQKGFKTVMTENIDQTSSRPTFQLWLRRFAFQCDRTMGGPLSLRLNMEVYQLLDATVYVVELERQVAHYLYATPLDRSRVIPHGLDEDALTDLAKPEPESDYLISVATIIPRKNPVLLAQAARLAQVPIVFLGKPFDENDPYFQQFKKLVEGRFVRYPGFVSRDEKHRLIRGARGFALLSQFESGCIAVYEAAAAGLPLLLPNLPWAARVYQDVRDKQFLSLQTAEGLAPKLRQFYQRAHRQPGQSFPIMSWRDVGRRYVELYESVLMLPRSAYISGRQEP